MALLLVLCLGTYAVVRETCRAAARAWRAAAALARATALEEGGEGAAEREPAGLRTPEGLVRVGVFLGAGAFLVVFRVRLVRL